MALPAASRFMAYGGPSHAHQGDCVAGIPAAFAFGYAVPVHTAVVYASMYHHGHPTSSAPVANLVGAYPQQQQQQQFQTQAATLSPMNGCLTPPPAPLPRIDCPNAPKKALPPVTLSIWTPQDSNTSQGSSEEWYNSCMSLLSF